MLQGLYCNVTEAIHGSIESNTTSWPILKAKTCQIFSKAEIPRWAKSCNNIYDSGDVGNDDCEGESVQNCLK